MLHSCFRKSIAATGSILSVSLSAFAQAPQALNDVNHISTKFNSSDAPPALSEAVPGVSLKGGSNGVMIVESKDARISLESGQVLRHIFLESEIYEVFWNGVLSDKFQYLRIDRCRFFVLYSETDNSIYAYDYRGYRYLVSALDMNSDFVEDPIDSSGLQLSSHFSN